MKLFLIIATALGFLGVALGAFGAHALSEKLEPRLLEVFKTGVQYQMYHALAILAVALLIKLYPEAGFSLAGWFFLGGIILFSGSLYVYTLSGVKVFAMITPVGGLSFLIGWIALFWQGMRM